MMYNQNPLLAKKTCITYKRFVVDVTYPQNPFMTYTYGKFKTEAAAQEYAYEMMVHVEKGVKAKVREKTFYFFK